VPGATSTVGGAPAGSGGTANGIDVFGFDQRPLSAVTQPGEALGPEAERKTLALAIRAWAAGLERSASIASCGTR